MAKYANFCANLTVLKQAYNQDLGNEFVKSGIIDKFAMQFELSWKLLRKTLEYEGHSNIATGSPRGIIKEAYSTYNFINEDFWLAMLTDRNTSEHIYDSELAQQLVGRILDNYIDAFEGLRANLEKLYPKDLLETF